MERLQKFREAEMKHHNIRPMALILLSATLAGLGLSLAHCVDPRLGRAQPIVVEWPEP